MYKLADKRSGEAGSITEGRLGIYRGGLGNSLSRRKTL